MARNTGRLRLALSVTTVIRILVGIAICLVVLSYSAQLAVRAFDWHPERVIVQFVNLDRERNLPTTFQTLLFLGCAISLAGIAVLKRLGGDRWARHWAFLALIFVLAGWDEIAEIHERLIEPMRRLFDLQGFLFFGWVVPGAIAALAVGLVYLRFIVALESGVRNRFILAGVLFLAGALAMESIGGWYYERIDQSTDMIYVTLTTIEESLEMTGLLLFLSTLLHYLARLLPSGRIEISGEPDRIWIDAVRNERP